MQGIRFLKDSKKAKSNLYFLNKKSLFLFILSLNSRKNFHAFTEFQVFSFFIVFPRHIPNQIITRKKLQLKLTILH